MKRKTYYFEQYGEFEIIIFKTTIWEVYYRMEDYPMKFAFGTSVLEPLSLVFDLARANAEYYRDLFTEEVVSDEED